jgi:vancomycin resistance protein VanJ
MKIPERTAPAPTRRNGHVNALVLANALALLGLWLFESRVGEAFWLSGLLCYIPQHLFGLPTLVLLAASLRRRRWKDAGAYALTLALFVHVFLGFQIPVASTWRRLSSEARGTPVRAMTYNILGGRRGVAPVAAVIRAQNPDVLFLQEAVVIGDSPDPVAPLLALLPGYNIAREGEVVIMSRFPILARRSRQFPDGANRFVLEAVLDVRGRPVRAICVHPYTITFRDPRRSFPERIAHSLKVRNAQVNVLLQSVDAPPSTWRREWRQAPILVAGDFNTPPRGRVYNALAARWSDSWREAGWGTGHSYRSDLPLVRIDYVWHSGHWSARGARTLKSLASDHRAVVVDLSLR